MTKQIKVGDRVEIVAGAKTQYHGKQGLVTRMGLAYDGIYAVVLVDKVKRSQIMKIDDLRLLESMQLDLLDGSNAETDKSDRYRLSLFRW